MLGSHDDQGGVIDTLAFQSLNHLAQGFIGLLQPISKDIGWFS